MSFLSLSQQNTEHQEANEVTFSTCLDLVDWWRRKYKSVSTVSQLTTISTCDQSPYLRSLWPAGLKRMINFSSSEDTKIKHVLLKVIVIPGTSAFNDQAGLIRKRSPQ